MISRPDRSSRSTTASALRATLASKRAPPSLRSITLASRYSRTASTSSAAVGLPKGATGLPLPTGSGAGSPGVTPSKVNRSHSLSQTRRPMAASSTERVDPLRCAEACNEQITAHFTVARTCHQCTRSRAIASPPAAA